MIEDLDEVLRQLLIRELPIKNGEVDIDFHQPKREWSSRINRPTLNLYLYDVVENTKLRFKDRQVKSLSRLEATQQLTPVRLDLNYMITVWATDPEDEHRLLTRTLMVLFRLAELPEDLLPASLRASGLPIPLEVARPGVLQNLTDIWSVLDNEMRPAVAATLTLAINPYLPVTVPLVRSREVRAVQAFSPVTPASLTEKPPERLPLQPVEQAGSREFWTVGGSLHGDLPLSTLRLSLMERGQEIPIQAEGRFTISGIQAGSYTLEITASGKPIRRQTITIPAPDYDIQL